LRKRNDTLAEIGEFAADQTVVRGVLWRSGLESAPYCPLWESTTQTASTVRLT